MQTVLNITYQQYDKKMISKIQNITENYILHLINKDFDKVRIDEIFTCLKIMLNGNYEKYKFDENTFDKIINQEFSENDFQKILSKLNEKQAVRKSNGVYYTPKDVVSFMVDNCFYKRIENNNKITAKLETYNDNTHFLLYNDSVFDPTCGTGEFLLGSLQKKIELIKRGKFDITDEKLLLVLNTIYGNDINIESIEIAKIRLFFEVIRYAESMESYQLFADAINTNMTCKDFVNVNVSDFIKFDIIIGNPPYVEDRKSPVEPTQKYGNIYANILQNSVDMLSENGIMGFIIPISYVSTPRMKKIRKYIERHTCQQFVMNYADRPDCLFVSVHQKLTILLAKKGRNKHELYTTGYKYWYKNERTQLFTQTSVEQNKFICDDFYPKIGNMYEKSIFNKVFTMETDSILGLNSAKEESNVFLNMRACFWIKAFSFNPGSKEYKGFKYDDKLKYFMLCLLNSSLFFLYWNMVSDCWHITLKELKYFRVPNSVEDAKSFSNIFVELQNKLEETKKYIGTKQTEYEYKHKLCKNVIDKIDDKLAEVYNLTEEELSYIKSYSSKYRESLGG